jgi:hypothetical protein
MDFLNWCLKSNGHGVKKVKRKLAGQAIYPRPINSDPHQTIKFIHNKGLAAKRVSTLFQSCKYKL